MKHNTYVMQIIMIAMCCIILTACGKKQEQKTEATIFSDEIAYEGAPISLEEVQGELEMCRVGNDKLYVLTSENGIWHMYSMELDGDNTAEIPISFSDNITVSNYYVNETGTLFLLESNIEDDNAKILVKCNDQGEELAQCELQSVLPQIEGVLNCITVDDTGNIILASDRIVYILNENLQLQDQIAMEEQGQIMTFVKTNSGKIACAVAPKDNVGKNVVCMLDIQKKGWESDVKLRNPPRVNEYCLLQSQQYDFYYKDGGGIYGYDRTKNAWECVLEARCSLLTKTDIDEFFGEIEGKFLSVLGMLNTSQQKKQLEVYTKLNPEDMKAKKTIVFAGYNVTNQLRTVARKFNQTHNDCRIQIKIYDDQNDEERTRLGLDITTGKVPDVFSISALGIPMNQLVKKGILEDLTPYFEKDSVVHMADVEPSVLEGMKINEKLYGIAPYFSLWSAACKSSDVGKMTGWTFEEMKEILSEKGDGAIAMDCVEKQEILYNFLVGNMSDYMDWDSGKCNFDSQEFQELLEFCNEGVSVSQGIDKEYDELSNQIARKIQQGKVLMVVNQNVVVDEIQMAREELGSDITYIGIPEEDRKGSYFIFSEQYGIYAGSDVKEEAWEFIRMVMDSEYQANADYINSGFYPTRTDCLNWKLKALMATEAYEDEYGNWIEPMETVSWETPSGLQFRTGPASQEDIDLIHDLIDRTDKALTIDEDSMNIIMEEAQTYFDGQKSVKKVADIIQKRVTTYVNEQR